MYLVRLSAQAKHLLGDIRLQVRTLANTTPISSASSGQMKKTPSKIKTDLPLWYFMVPKSQRPPIVCEYVREKENQMEQLSLLTPKDLDGRGKKVYIKVYGCQMNVNDTEIATSILTASGYKMTNNIEEANIAFVMTCTIRESTDNKMWSKLRQLAKLKARGKARGDNNRLEYFGVLGCMASRLKTTAVREIVPEIDLIVAPDAYRELPRLLASLRVTGKSAVNVLLSLNETYANVMPLEVNKAIELAAENAVAKIVSPSAFVSISRGCNSMCSFCVVPITRGRERSRPIGSIIEEVIAFAQQGKREIVLLGQNINSYCDLRAAGSRYLPPEQLQRAPPDPDDTLRTPYKGVAFHILLDEVARAVPNVRIRFYSPHPGEFSDQVIEVMARHHNIAKGLHLSAQSGSDRVLKDMNRGHSKADYLELITKLRTAMPSITFNSDFITGFCGETKAEHSETIDLIQKVGYKSVFVYAYSPREKTAAWQDSEDDVSKEVKQSRLMELIQVYRTIAYHNNQSLLGQRQLVLLKSEARKNNLENHRVNMLVGTNDADQKVFVPKITSGLVYEVGDFVAVEIVEANSTELLAKPIEVTNIEQFYN